MSNPKAAKARVLADLSPETAALIAQLMEGKVTAADLTGGVKPKSITLGEFQGHPTVTFALPGKRPFYVSVNKLNGIFANEAEVKALLKTIPKK